MAIKVTQPLGRAVSLKKKMRQNPSVKLQVIVMAQVVVALAGKVLVVMRLQMWSARRRTLMVKLRKPAMRLRGQMMKATPVLWNPMMKF